MANDAEVQLAVDQAMKDQKKQKRKKKLIIFGVILAVIVVIVVVANRPKDYNFDQPVARVTVDTVMTDFKNDAANATEKYSDQVIAVTGQVDDVNDSYARLRAYDDDLWLYYVNVYIHSVTKSWISIFKAKVEDIALVSIASHNGQALRYLKSHIQHEPALSDFALSAKY